MALIDGGPRSASAVARKATELVVVDRPTFVRLTREVPDLALKLMQLFAARLRAANTRAPSETALSIPRAPRTRPEPAPGPAPPALGFRHLWTIFPAHITIAPASRLLHPARVIMNPALNQ